MSKSKSNNDHWLDTDYSDKPHLLIGICQLAFLQDLHAAGYKPSLAKHRARTRAFLEQLNKWLTPLETAALLASNLRLFAQAPGYREDSWICKLSLDGVLYFRAWLRWGFDRGYFSGHPEPILNEIIQGMPGPVQQLAVNLSLDDAAPRFPRWIRGNN